MSERSEYAGRISQSGSQSVKAPRQKTDAKKSKVKTGSDLRTGKK